MLKFLTAVSHQETNNFNFIGWHELALKIEKPKQLGELHYQDAKEHSEVIAANDAPNKRKETVLAHDNFTLLRIDADDTKDTIQSLSDLLDSLGIESYIIHTTASHQQQGKGNRYRIYIQLANALCFDLWEIIQRYLCYLLNADDCSNRPQQIMYLPVRYTGDKYEFKINTGKPLNVLETDLFNDAKMFNQTLAQEQLAQQEAAILKPIKPSYNERLIGNQVSVIDAVNKGYDWESLLSSYGYKRQGKAYLPPEATSNKAGAYILASHTDGKLRYFSHHQNDTCATGQALDKFDFLCIRAFAGDEKAAIKGLAVMFPEIDKHNKKVFADHMKSSELKQSLYGKGANYV